MGEDYEELVTGYSGRAGAGVTTGRWDNVRRGPVMHVSQDPDFVPDRSNLEFPSCTFGYINLFGLCVRGAKTV